MTKLWIGVVAGAFLITGSTWVAAQQGETPQAQPPATEAPQLPQGEGEAPHPIEPILVQGYVKTLEAEQLTLTAPGAPVDLPLSLREETRFIEGENDVEPSSLREGQLVRAALLPVGEDLVALVVEVVPDEPQAPAAPRGQGGAGGSDGLQGEEPPARPEPIEPQPAPPPPGEPAPQPTAPGAGETQL